MGDVRIEEGYDDGSKDHGIQVKTQQQQQKKRLDLSSLDGLRGVLAVWIMLHHCCIYNRAFFIDLQGSSLMPMFFLLTGYQCAIAYRTILPSDSDQLIQSSSTTSSSKSSPSLTNFYRGRIARVLPGSSSSLSTPSSSSVSSLLLLLSSSSLVYFFTNLLILPPEYLGYMAINPMGGLSAWLPSWLSTITLTSTLFFFFLGWPFDVVTWTVQTFFWYHNTRHH